MVPHDQVLNSVRV